MIDNHGATSLPVLHLPREQEMELFDLLPRELREALNSCVNKFCVTEVFNAYKAGKSIEFIISRLHYLDLADVQHRSNAK